MKKPKFNENTTRNFEKLITNLLRYFGENPQREGLKETPKRMIQMYSELLNGYNMEPPSVIKTFSSKGYKDLITVTNIEFYSLCEHHLIPFFGKVHIGYIPNGKILGLSKFARLVEIYSRRLQTQENLTNQVASALEKYLNPKGYIIHVEAQHLCVNMRGIKKNGFLVKTTVIKGILKNRKSLLTQFYRDIKR